MPSAETEALALATREDGSVDVELFNTEYKRALAERQDRLVRESQGVLRSVDGWRSIESEEDWARAVRQADEGLQNGSFLIERLGGQRYVDPELMAALVVLRNHLIEEYGASTAAELMMVDSALLAYYHQLKVSGWIGNLAVAAESEFFGPASLTSKLVSEDGRNATVRGLRVEELAQRLAEQLMPLLDRSNKILLRNLTALREHRRTPTPGVNITSARQVNVGGQQVNLATDGDQRSRRQRGRGAVRSSPGPAAGSDMRPPTG